MKRYLLLLPLLFLGGAAIGQVKFSYDNAGNRIKRFTGSGARMAAETPLPKPAEESPVVVYPNPVKERLYLKVPDAGNVLQVRILSSSGMPAAEISGYPAAGIPVRELPAGVYLAVIVSRAVGESVVRFVKE